MPSKSDIWKSSVSSPCTLLPCALRQIVEMLVEAELGIEAGLLPLA